MELDEFVRDTLVQIITGVKQAQDAARSLGAVVNAFDENRPGAGGLGGREIRPVEFDVAVTTESASGGGAKVAVWGIGAGMEGSSKDSVVSRIRFSIPVALPKGNPS